MCKGWGWPTRVKHYPEEFKQQTFFEGSFLRMLFNKLDGMLDQVCVQSIRASAIEISKIYEEYWTSIKYIACYRFFL